MRYSIRGASVDQVRGVGGAKIKEAKSIGIIFANLDDAQASKLRSAGCLVAKIEGIKTVVTPPTPIAAVPTYSPRQLVSVAGIDDARYLIDPPLFGEGFNIAVIDTGIHDTHEQVSGQVIHERNFSNSPPGDGFDHGTGVASIALAVAPKSGILDLKVIDDDGEGTEEEVTLAIDYCIELIDTNPEIAPYTINLSIGSADDGNPNSILRVACRAAVERGIMIMAAAGNDGPASGTILCPACEKYVAAIGSVSLEPFAISSFSSRGPTKEGLIKPDAVFFGENIDVASSRSNTATMARSGTSFSAPFGSGISSIYLEAVYKQAVIREVMMRGAPADDVAYFVSIYDILDNFLPRICIKPSGPGLTQDNTYGYGLPYGPQLIRSFAGAGADMSALLTGVIAIGMIGMMMKVAK